MRYPIQNFRQTVVLPSGSDTVIGANIPHLNGMLRTISVNAPDLDGSNFKVYILGRRQEHIYTSDNLTKNTDNVVNGLAIPVSANASPVIKIKSQGSPDATGALTIASDASVVADGDTVTINGPTDSRTYRFKNTTAQANDVKIVPHVAASGDVISTANGIPTENDTIVVGEVTYRFRDTLAQVNDVKIGADGEATLNNLRATINLTGTEGVEYFAGQTIHPTVSAPSAAAFDDPDYTLTLQAKTAGSAGNSIVLTESAANTTVTGAGTLANGVDNGFETLENLELAINANGVGNGSDYHAGTAAHGDVTGSRTNGVLTVTAKEPVESGEDVITTESSGVLSWGAGTLVSGGESAERTFIVDLYIERV